MIFILPSTERRFYFTVAHCHVQVTAYDILEGTVINYFNFVSWQKSRFNHHVYFLICHGQL